MSRAGTVFCQAEVGRKQTDAPDLEATVSDIESGTLSNQRVVHFGVDKHRRYPPDESVVGKIPFSFFFGAAAQIGFIAFVSPEASAALTK